jgi:hypothetical protein
VGTILLTTLGLAIIIVTLRDVIHELFHPERTGSISASVMRANWRVMRRIARWHRRWLYNAGPLMLVSVATVWVALFTLGWALIYAPRLPSAFHISPGLPAASTHGAWTAFYVSITALGTLGTGDFAPQYHFLRVLYPLESLVGAVMVTAWISWVLSIYPVLASRRSFTREVAVFRKTHPMPTDAVREAPADAIAETLRSFTEQIVAIGSQLQQTRVTYYFQDTDAERNLVCQLPYVLDLAIAAAVTPDVAPAITYYGGTLRCAVEQVLGEIGSDFLGVEHGEPREVLAHLRGDHLLEGDTGCGSSSP